MNIVICVGYLILVYNDYMMCPLQFDRQMLPHFIMRITQLNMAS